MKNDAYKDLEKIINNSNKTEPSLLAMAISYIVFSVLLGWWATWIIPHFTDKVYGFWTLTCALFLTYMFVLPQRISWIPFTLCAGSTIWIWFFM